VSSFVALLCCGMSHCVMSHCLVLSRPVVSCRIALSSPVLSRRIVLFGLVSYCIGYVAMSSAVRSRIVWSHCIVSSSAVESHCAVA